MSAEPAHYIGDGVYATFDGYHIWLTTHRDGREHLIAIVPEVLGALMLYAARVGMLKEKGTDA